MLRSRIIPCLLVQKNGLVKTTKFKEPKYVGDPINAVRIFNEKEADELIVLDIDATREARTPDLKMIKALADECRMPFCYGGGITTVEQAVKIIGLGVEKIALSHSALEDIGLCKEIGKIIGNQSVVIVIDVKKKRFGRGYEIYTHNGKKKSKWELLEFISEIDNLGIGEIIINSIDNDGVMKGYDYSLMKIVRNQCKIPITALGGASSLYDIKKLISKFGIVGASAGSIFVFKGKYKAVLITYPNREERKKLY